MLLSDKFTHHRYEVLNARHVMVSAPLSALKELQRLHPDKITEIAAVHPEMKICDNVRQWQTLSRSPSLSLSSPLIAGIAASLSLSEGLQQQLSLSSQQVDLARNSRFASQFHLHAYSQSPSQDCLLERFTTRPKGSKASSSKGLQQERDLQRHGAIIERSPRFSLSIRMHHIAKESSEWQGFSGFLNRVRQDFAETVRLSPVSAQDTPSMLYLTVDILDCAHVYELALMFASRPEVVWIERAFTMELHNRWSKGICDTGTTEVETLNFNNFTGSGEIVGIADTGLDLKNCYFYDPDAPTFSYQSSSVSASATPVTNPSHRKVLQYIAFNDRYDDSEDAHGTHVAGTVAGLAYKNYGDYKKFNGMSPEAKIAFFDLGDANEKLSTPGNINTDLFQKLYKAGARIFTNSWGTASSNSYDEKAVQVDTFMWNYPEALVLFSAGNTGASGYNTVSSPSTNKNGISVGASGNAADSWKGTTLDGSVATGVGENAVAYFSSRGPTADARQKPDVLAPGFYVYSARGYYNSSSYFCESHGLSGTSMAAPTVAGFAVKVRQYFKQGYYPTGKPNADNAFTPSGALIKAMLVHSGQEMSYLLYNSQNATTLSKGYPSKEQGYGRIQLNKVLNFNAPSVSDPLSLYVIGNTDSTDSDKYVAFTAAGSKTFSFTTAASQSTSEKVRVTFAYTDYPGSSSSSNPLTNVLTMSVKNSVTGTVYSPLLQSGIDRDNTQVVDIESPSPSTAYVVTITASTLVQSPQPIALVISSPGLLTYNLTAVSTAEASEYDYSTSSTYISTGAREYIVVLGILVLVFGAFAWYFRRLTGTRKAVSLNPRNYERQGDVDAAEQESGQAQSNRATANTAQPSLFARVFGSGGGGSGSANSGRTRGGSSQKPGRPQRRTTGGGERQGPTHVRRSSAGNNANPAASRPANRA